MDTALISFIHWQSDFVACELVWSWVFSCAQPGTTYTSESRGISEQTAWCTSPIFVVSQC